MDNFEILNKEDKFKGFLKVKGLTLKQKKADGSWSNPFSRELLERGRAAAVLVRDPVSDKILFTKQLRVGALNSFDPYIIELVAGMIDGEENPESTINRETEEETGVTGLLNVELISKYYPSPGACTEEVALYYAEADLSNLASFGGCESENEVIEVLSINTEEAFRLLRQGFLNTSINQIALYWLLAERLEGRKK